MSFFNIVAATNEDTVVATYEPSKVRSDSYQSEAELEKEFIRLLCEQGYTYLPLHTEDELIANLRSQLEELNHYQFSDTEWQQFFSDVIANPNEHIPEKTRKIQEDNVQVLHRDDGSSKNITLIDKKNIHNNRLQVINQYEVKQADGARHDNRYDVTILVNGFPLVHVELKRRGVAIREAFNQINRYQRDSFWAGCGLYEYTQIFVISNGTNTKYYSNSTRYNAIKDAKHGKTKKEKTSNSFEFTSYWADANNRVLTDLIDFTRTFFAKHTILSVLTRYCIFTSEKMLMVMRPYQITATERILNRIEIANNYKKYGSIEGGGYIWHTTGSGKTLTSFKTARLASQLPYIDKVLFVVDRKDLDYQTMKEYDRFEKGAANGNTSTQVLQRQLEDRDAKGNPHTYKIIITTIQKLALFVSRNKGHEIFQKHVVLIFDECHRSQFGEMHASITKHFKNYHLFGFTGTPIFADNAGSGRNFNLRTTEQAFGDKLHTYTIVDAIRDENVLPFRVDYIQTIRERDQYEDQKVYDIYREGAYKAAARVDLVTNYILDHFAQKTKRSHGYSLKGTRVMGFNSILATASIDMAKVYYTAFKRIQEERGGERLKVAIIYSFGPNEADDGCGLPDESFDVESLDTPSRDFLADAIADYNAMFSTSFDTSSQGFQNYYKDLSDRMKKRQVDLTIVVNMFLTGFDATTLNTLWVDKDLRDHGLIQAFSRTNRILNSVKTYGNIVCFRNLEDRVNHAISLFGDKEAGGVVLLKPYAEYLGEYRERLAQLREQFPLESVLNGNALLGEEAEKAFIRLFGVILRLRNILTAFDDFAADDTLNPRDEQDYRSVYTDLYQKWRKQKEDATIINDDLVFEVELLKQVDINIDYVLMLVQKYHDSNCTDKMIIGDIERAIGASYELRNKKDLIEAFIDSLDSSNDVTADWEKYLAEAKERELSAIIEEEALDDMATREFMANAFVDGGVPESGTEVASLMTKKPSRFAPANAYADMKARVLERLKGFFDRFNGLGR